MDNDQDQSSDGTVEEFLLAGEAAEKGGHPAWQEILNAVPEEFHEALRPTLEKWDSGVQKRFNSLHSQYAPLKDYAEVDPQLIAAGLNLINRIEEDPKAVWDLMRDTYQFESGTTGEQGAPMTVTGNGNFDEQDEYARQIAAQQQQLEELKQQQQRLLEEAESARMASELDAYLAHLHQEHGDFDNDYVVTLMANGVDGNEAVSRFNSLVESIRGNAEPTPESPTSPSAPSVMGSGGGVPSRSVDPKSLSNSETKDLVAQLLEQTQTG